MKNIKLIVISLILGLFTFEEGFAANTNTTGSTATQSKYSLSYDQIKMAAESGDADAQYALGYMYYYGKSGAPKDVNLAKTWISKAALQKQPQAVKALALMNGGQTQPSSQSPAQTAVPSATPAQQPMTTMPSTQVPESNNASKEALRNSGASLQRNDVQPEQKLAEKKPFSEKHAAVENNVPSANSATEKMTYVDMRHQKDTETTNKDEPVVSAAGSTVGAYTLQVLGASNRQSIRKLVTDHHLSNAKIYKTTFKDKDWYVLIYGQYQTMSEAKEAAKRLGSELALKPWVKPYASVKHYHLTSAAE